jgi:hypothetical protein
MRAWGLWIATELDDLFGDGELYRILFKRRSSAAKATRRARIRMLTRLTEVYTYQLADRSNKAHVELVGLLRGLAEKR